jgi:hypothetical protein
MQKAITVEEGCLKENFKTWLLEFDSRLQILYAMFWFDRKPGR